MPEREINQKAMQRYPIYLKALRKFKNEGRTRIQSKELAEVTNIDAATIRRDFHMMGKLGTKGKGYNVVKLTDYLSKQLGLNDDEKLILVGTGKLGLALLNYNTWNDTVGEIVCAFDESPKNASAQTDIPVYSIRRMNEKIPDGCRIAILCTSRNTQDVVNKLVENNIRAIINFTTEHFSVPKGIIVNDVDIVSDIQQLVVRLNKEDRDLERALERERAEHPDNEPPEDVFDDVSA